MPVKSKYLGTHQEVHYNDFGADRFGVITGTAERHMNEDFDNPQFQLLYLTEAPAIGGMPIPCVGSRRSYIDKQCRAIYTYSYEGAVSGFDQNVFCDLQGTDTEEPIETHPGFADLYAKYKGQSNGGKFDYFQKMITLPDGSKGLNPLYGVTHFLTMGMIWTRTYIVLALPVTITQRVDCIDTPLGFKNMQPPALNSPRNWLKLAPAVQQRGNVIQVADRWMASGKRGFNTDMYSEKYKMS